MGERLLHGTPASPGLALGRAWRLPEAVAGSQTVAPEQRAAERARARRALAGAADALSAVAGQLAEAEREIVESGVLMAQDPALLDAVETAIQMDGVPASEAILRATSEHAEAIAAIGDAVLAARADDVRSLGRRAARLAAGAGAELPPGSDLVLIAQDAGPADVAEAAHALAGVALAGGGATAHAAIVARSLGIPMATGLGASALEIVDGAPLLLDGSSGALTLDPARPRAEAGRRDMEARRHSRERAYALREQPAVTTDGRRIGVLANVASAEELQVALRAGAEGIGLLRTELAFLDAADWPTEAEHVEALSPVLDGLGLRPAVIRVLDFGADKAPPFLHAVTQRGLALLLTHPDAFAEQMRAILRAGQGRDVRIMLPMVTSATQLDQAHAVLTTAALRLGLDALPPLGAMIETPLAAQHAGAIAERAAFLSVGTNDLTAATLGVDRFAANPARAHHPRVLRAIARSVAGAREAGVPIEVCGEAASDPVMVPLLIGLGIDELSVGAARVGQVREWIRRLDAAEMAGLARSALTMDTAEEVAWAAAPVATELQGDQPAAAALRR